MAIDWNKQDLENMLTVIAEVMPHPEAQKVIAVCLTKAGLATFAVGLNIEAVQFVVHHDPDESWDNDTIHITVNGVNLTIKVSVDE